MGVRLPSFRVAGGGGGGVGGGRGGGGWGGGGGGGGGSPFPIEKSCDAQSVSCFIFTSADKKSRFSVVLRPQNKGSTASTRGR